MQRRVRDARSCREAGFGSSRRLMNRLLPYVPLFHFTPCLPSPLWQVRDNRPRKNNRRGLAFCRLPQARGSLALGWFTISFGYPHSSSLARACLRFAAALARGVDRARSPRPLSSFTDNGGLRSRWPQSFGRQGRTWRPRKALGVGPISEPIATGLSRLRKRTTACVSAVAGSGL
jgi:hypothetical protein